MMQPSFPFSSLEALAKESMQKKEKAEKLYFYLRHNKSNQANLDRVFSEFRSGTIAHKNKKTITADTQWVVAEIGPDGLDRKIWTKSGPNLDTIWTGF